MVIKAAARKSHEYKAPELDVRATPGLYIGYYSRHKVVVETVGVCVPQIFAKAVQGRSHCCNA